MPHGLQQVHRASIRTGRQIRCNRVGVAGEVNGIQSHAAQSAVVVESYDGLGGAGQVALQRDGHAGAAHAHLVDDDGFGQRQDAGAGGNGDRCVILCPEEVRLGIGQGNGALPELIQSGAQREDEQRPVLQGDGLVAVPEDDAAFRVVSEIARVR